MNSDPISEKRNGVLFCRHFKTFLCESLMATDKGRLKQIYESWKTEDLMKAVTIDKAQYEPTAIDLMVQEIKKRNMSDDDIEKFPQTYSRQIIFEQIHNFVIQQIGIGANKWTIAKSLEETGMDRREALELVETIQAQILRARGEEPQQEPITVKPFKESEKDIRPLIALIFFAWSLSLPAPFCRCFAARSWFTLIHRL